MRQPSADGAWHAALPTKDLEPGQYRVLVRATDRVGYASKQRRLVTIGPPAAAKRRPPRKRAPSRAASRSKTAVRCRTSASACGKPRRAAVTDSEGRFTFKDVPHGKYTIDAKGTGLGRELSGSKEIVLPAPVEPAVVELRLEW